jgi:flagellin-like hook-associated protein FlgL
VRGVYVRADVNVDIEYTSLANGEGFKGVLNALALIERIDIDRVSQPNDVNPDPNLVTAPGATRAEQQDNFFKLYNDLIKHMTAANKKITAEQESLQRVQLQMNNLSRLHKEDTNYLETTLGLIENADTTDLAVKINALQLQLQAAYQVTARISQLSLSQFI